MTKNLGPSNCKNWNTAGGTINSAISCCPELVPPKKIGPPSWIWESFWKIRKGLLHHVECFGT